MNKNVAFLIPSLKNGGAERVLSNMSLNLSEDINQSIIVWNASSIDYEYKADILDISIDNKRSILANANVLFERIKNVYLYIIEWILYLSVIYFFLKFLAIYYYQSNFILTDFVLFVIFTSLFVLYFLDILSTVGISTILLKSIAIFSA